jgi:NAD-dependent protein deacetylase/lipoamidase
MPADCGNAFRPRSNGSFFKIVTLRGRFVRRTDRQELTRMVESLTRVRRGPFKLLRLLRAIRPMLRVGPFSAQRPGLVLFGDALAEPDWTWAQRDVEGSDLMLVVGTSGLVWPAATLPEQVLGRGGHVIAIDPNDGGSGQVWLRGPAGEVLPRLVEAAFGTDPGSQP